MVPRKNTLKGRNCRTRRTVETEASRLVGQSLTLLLPVTFGD